MVVAMTLRLHMYSFQLFANAYYLIHFACWYLYVLVNPNKDKLCLLIYLDLYCLSGLQLRSDSNLNSFHLYIGRL